MAYVLIIDDEPTINMILQEVLRDEGHEVASAHNGTTGLEKMRKMPHPGLVICDLRMPDISGRTVVETMRSEAELKEIPVIITTGAVFDTDEFPPDGSYQATFSKPFDLIDIIEKVQELTGG